MQKLIAIDGQHGAGKSFLVDKLYQELLHKGYSVVKTKEPTDSEIGQFARNAENLYAAEVLACLFAADRIQHCQQIQSWLNTNQIVISDRYIISSLILQGMDGVSFDYINQLNSRILMPDLSVIVYASPVVIEERLKFKKKSRLAWQERKEGYDRYLKYGDHLKVLFPNLHFFPNNTVQECQYAVEWIVGQIGEE